MAKSSIDCVDCRQQEKQPFDPRNFSYKVNDPGFRYEVALCIQTGDIVWVNGPFKPVDWNDDMIGRSQGFWEALGRFEYFLADSIYTGWRALTPNGRNNQDQYMKSVARARHETVNASFKRFACLRAEFRHGEDRHESVFHAIATVCQIEFEVESPLFQVYYDDLRWDPYE